MLYFNSFFSPRKLIGFGKYESSPDHRYKVSQQNTMCFLLKHGKITTRWVSDGELCLKENGGQDSQSNADGWA